MHHLPKPQATSANELKQLAAQILSTPLLRPPSGKSPLWMAWEMSPVYLPDILH